MHSDKVPYYILDLLQQVPSVFVPGLGRFDAIFHPAVIDLQSSRIKPPHIRADFVPDVSSETDLLPAYMQYVSGIDIGAAKEVIRDFVQDVLSRIADGETYSIEQFGTFSRSSLDVLHFTPDWDAFNLSFNGLEEIDLYPAPLPVTPAVVEEKPITPTPEIVHETWRQPLAEPEPIAKITEPQVEETPPVVVEETQPPVQHGVNESTTRLAWIILTTALILITGLCAYLAWDIISGRKRINQMAENRPDSLAIINPVDTGFKTGTSVPVDTSMTSNTPADKTDTMISQPAEEQKNETPDVIKQPIERPVNRNDSLCFIVVGAFSNQENVDKMVSRLEGLGYASERIKGGALTRVAISTSCEKENLQRVLSEARSSINPEAWIY